MANALFMSFLIAYIIFLFYLDYNRREKEIQRRIDFRTMDLKDYNDKWNKKV